MTMTPDRAMATLARNAGLPVGEVPPDTILSSLVAKAVQEAALAEFVVDAARAVARQCPPPTRVNDVAQFTADERFAGAWARLMAAVDRYEAVLR